jgi:hypothetical protein
MGFLNDASNALLEGLGVQTWGPDWRAKRALTEAQVPQTQAETAGQVIQNQRGEVALDQSNAELEQLQRDLAAKRKMAEAGILPAEELKVAEFLAAQDRAKLEGRLTESQIDENNARAQYYRSGGSQHQQRPRMVQTKDGWVWAYPPNAGGQTVDTGLDLPPTADQRNRGSAVDRAQPVLDSIDELSLKINTMSGPAARMAGGLRTGAAFMNMDDDVSEYSSMIEGFIPLFARAAGHSGVLTEQDVTRTRRLFPQVGDSLEVRNRKMARVKRIWQGQEAYDVAKGDEGRLEGATPALDTDIPTTSKPKRRRAWRTD